MRYTKDKHIKALEKCLKTYKKYVKALKAELMAANNLLNLQKTKF